MLIQLYFLNWSKFNEMFAMWETYIHHNMILIVLDIYVYEVLQTGKHTCQSTVMDVTSEIHYSWQKL